MVINDMKISLHKSIKNQLYGCSKCKNYAP